MNTMVKEVEQNPAMYKVCNACGSLSFHINKWCILCRENSFNCSEHAVIEYVKREHEVYRMDHITDEEIDNMEIFNI